MKILQHPKIKAALSAGLGVALLGVTAGCTAMAYDNYRGDSSYGNDYRNGEFGRISQKLRQDLRRSGYHVMDIKPDTHRSNRSLTVYAKKNNQPYELKYTYPGLKRISSNKKEWSNIWQDKNHNNRYKNDDIEDNIKREARYPTIKNRAINKVQGMGYRVKDIELDEKNNRGVFEIEAKRGSQEYEILLGYPNLNVIKIEKD